MVAWRRGLWRLTLVLWIGGLAVLAFASDAFGRRHAQGTPPPELFLPRELCGGIASLFDNQIGLVEGTRTSCRADEDDLSPAQREQLAAARVHHDAEQAAWEGQLRPAILTRSWWRERAPLMAAFWTAACWGTFYVLAWVAAGFRR